MFKKLDSAQIAQSLSTQTRQYLVGHLQRPQNLAHLDSEDVEIGISSYETFATEATHRHSVAVEYQYVLSGWTAYLDADTQEEHHFTTGDFYAIYPGTSYAQKSKPGTRILFIKVPSINDKELVEENSVVIEWMAERLKTVRTDYFYDLNAPEPNSIRPAAAVAIAQGDKILMVKRGDSGYWSLPGGTLDFGESLPSCATREVLEETGLTVQLKDIVGTYTDPNIRISYSDGEIRQEFTVVYYAETCDMNVVLDGESSAYRWVKYSELNALEMVHSQRRRINDLIAFIEEGRKVMG